MTTKKRFLGVYIFLVLLLFFIQRTLMVVHPVQNSQQNNKVNWKIVPEFIGSLVSERLVHCTIVFAHSGHGDPISGQAQGHRPALNQFSDTNSLIIDQVSKATNKEILLVDFSRDFISVKRDSSINRRGGNCFANIISLADSSPEILSKFSSLITWKYGALTWKDSDYYIFYKTGEPGGKNSLDSLLLSNVTLKIKFKIAVGHETSSLSTTKIRGENSRSNFVVKAACFYCNSGRPSIVTFGELVDHWLTDRRLPTLDLIFPDFVVNLHGYKIRAAVSSKIVYRIEIYQQPDGSWKGKPGVHTRLIELCKTKLNFTYELFPSIGGGGSGVRWPNGTWTGSMADILYENADFGMVTAQTLQRDELVSFSFPITYDWLTFATGIPRPIHTWKAVFWPFSAEFWFWIVISILFTMLSLYVIAIFSHTGGMNVDRVFLYIFGSLMDQYFIDPKSVALKFICGFWVIFVLNVSTAYRSELVSCLAFPFVEAPPETFEQLTQSSYTWGLYYLAGAAYSAFRSSTNPTYVKIFKGMDIEHSAVNCLVRAIETRFGCIIYEASAIDVGYRNLSDRHGRHPIIVSPATTFFISSCWVMEKRVIFRPNFERLMHFSYDMGLNMRWVEMNYQRVRDERPKEAKNIAYHFSTDGGPEPLTNDNFIGSYFILAFGLMAGTVMFLAEKNWNFLRKHLKGKVDAKLVLHKFEEGILTRIKARSQQAALNTIPSISITGTEDIFDSQPDKYWNMSESTMT